MKKKYTDEVIKILYNAQINNKMIYPEKEINDLEEKIGTYALYEVFEDLHNYDYTKIVVKKMRDTLAISVIKPFLTLDALKHAEYLLKPAFIRFFIDLKNNKINWTKWGVIIAFFTWGIGLILNALVNLDKIEANYNKYFVHKKPASIEQNKTSKKKLENGFKAIKKP
jgi:hypothetical protein